MRMTPLAALLALAALSSVITACTAHDGDGGPRLVDVENGTMTPLATDGGSDSGPLPPPPDGGGTGGARVHQFKAASDVASASGGNGYELQFNLRAGKSADGAVHIDFSSMSVDLTSFTCVTPPWWDPIWGPPPLFCGYTRRVFTTAFGTLPGASFKSAGGFAYVKATLVNGPTLYVSSCTYDETTGFYACQDGVGGDVDVRWRTNGLTSYLQTGTSQKTYGPFAMKTSGQVSSDSADVTGSVLGTNVDGSYGEIFRSAGASIQFDATFKP